MELKDLKIKGVYRQKDLPVENFLIPSLKYASCYDRAVGYFRSSIYLLITSGLYQFVKNNGKIRILCSPNLTPEDTKTIYESNNKKREVINNDIIEVLNDNNNLNQNKILATLIKFGYLDFRFVFKESGIYHEKWGLISDFKNNIIYFNGSFNETHNAWNYNYNLESLSTRCSWKLGEDKEIIHQSKKS